MSLSDYLENKLNDAVLKNTAFAGGANVYVALHTGAPGETGANEVAGGSYARQAVAAAGWNASAAGLSDNVGAIIFALMPACTVVAASIWDAASAGNLLHWGWLATVRKLFVANDVATDLLRSPAHGLAADARVALSFEGDGVQPTGLDDTTLYWVIATGLGADEFKLSTTQGGAAVNYTGQGAGKFYKVVPQVVNLDGTIQFNAGNLDVIMR